MTSKIPNPFLDCSLDELVEAWRIFSSRDDHACIDTEAMSWVSEALDLTLFLHSATINGRNITMLIEL